MIAGIPRSQASGRRAQGHYLGSRKDPGIGSDLLSRMSCLWRQEDHAIPNLSGILTVRIGANIGMAVACGMQDHSGTRPLFL
jgi:hypothetical protein